MFKLVISDDEGKTTVVPLVRDEISIGRKEGNTIRLTERNVSRRHAELQRTGQSFVVRDVSARYGIFVNGQRVQSETPFAPGDKLKIGDYVLSLELEKEENTKAKGADRADGAAHTIVTPPGGVHSQLPARLVMLTAPRAGATYPIPRAGARIGRSEGVEVPIREASVSREHARIEVQDDDVYIIVDLGSANGIRVNGEQVQRALLTSGDIVQLGDVQVRFIAAGEPATGGFQDPSRKRRKWALGFGFSVLGFAVLKILLSSGEAEGEVAASGALATSPAADLSFSTEEAAAVNDHDPQTHVSQCRAAIEGGRYLEALAHANRALATLPDDRQARDCREAASAGHEDEQVFVAGQRALEQGDAEAAYLQFSQLRLDSPFRERPEVGSVTAQVATQRLALARARLDQAPEEALHLTGQVLEMRGAPRGVQNQARVVRNQARRQLKSARVGPGIVHPGGP